MSVIIDGTNGITTNSGTLISTSTIGVGGTTPANTGAGISFPAAQSASSDANTLDDYEEGTFTPSFSTGVTSPVYGEQTGSYTKIGRFVSFSIRLFLTSGTGSGAQVVVSGLPFTSSSATGVRGTATGAYLDASALVLAGDISTATTTIGCYQYGGSNYIFAGSLASKYFYICGSYYTA